MIFKRNNPLNIRHNPKNKWLGQIGSDNGFCVFKDRHHGFRAAFILLHTYYTIYGFRTIDAIIERWAPPEENPTANYINYVLGMCPNLKMDGSRFMYVQLLSAMACFETGKYISPHYVSTSLSQFDL